MKALNIPASNIRKFRSMATATAEANSQSYRVPVILGDDGKYWITSTPREASKLRNAGYDSFMP